ncbi:MAG: SH3 domain-containing protein [Caldilineaceae bacterium]
MLNRIFGVTRWLVHYWILSTVALFALLVVYTSSPIFGQSPNPTPDIKTVPEPAMVPTATNTPFPTVTPVEIPQVPEITVTPSGQHDKNQDTNGDTGSNVGDENGGAAGDSGGGVAAGDGQTDNSSVADTQTFTQTNNAPTGKVLVAVLNLRKSPGTGSAIIDTLFRNDIVQVQARSADGGWWLVCCGADTKGAGWVSAKLIRPNFNLAQVNSLLPMMAGSSPAPATPKTPSGTSNPILATAPLTTSRLITASNVLTGGKAVTLLLQMRPSPAFVWQGQLVNLQFVITNRSQSPAVNVRLRDDLPTALQYTAAAISHNGQFQQQAKAAGSSIISLAWPQLAAGSEVTATVTLRVAANLPNGSLIDNLAVVAADNAGDVPAGVTLAMPPTVLPVFK